MYIYPNKGYTFSFICRYLEDKPYSFINREKILVKGLGLRTTYFVEPEDAEMESIPSSPGSAVSRTCQSVVAVEQRPQSAMDRQVIGPSTRTHGEKYMDSVTGSQHSSTGTRLNYKAPSSFKSGRSRLNTEVADISTFPETEELVLAHPFAVPASMEEVPPRVAKRMETKIKSSSAHRTAKTCIIV